MSKIMNNEYFGSTQGVSIKRSRLNANHSIHTTFTAGKLIPIEWQEVLPGQTISYDLSALVRGSTPKFTVMDSSHIDLYAFFVPNRLLWEHWQQFMGESDDAWSIPTNYSVPQIYFDNTSEQVKVGDILDYLGLPCELSLSNGHVNALPLRAYIKIWNDWFRDQNIYDSIPLYVGDNSIYYRDSSQSGATIYTNSVKGGMLLPVMKKMDYFTACLPDPQRGPSVKIPFNDGSDGSIPLVGFYSDGDSSTLKVDSNSKVYLDGVNTDTLYGLNFNAYAGTINELRMAFALQRYYELLARSGSRYVEILQNFFNVTNGDSRLQRSEYLGGSKTRLNINQVIQTSKTDSSDVLGKTGGYSLTTMKNSMFTKSFTEHGIFMLVGCIRHEISYCQGVSKQFNRSSKFDYYWPQFQNIGEQPVYKHELYYDSSSPDSVFGYNEAWAEYRYYPNKLTGYMRTNITQSLGKYWTYGDNYASAPSLSEDWMKVDATNITRTFALTSESPYSFLADFNIIQTNVLPMELYSIPGLCDHN